MIYKKEDAVISRGLANLAMVVLHLFCIRGEDVFYALAVGHYG